MRRHWLLRLFLYVADAALFILGFYLAFRIRFGSYIPGYNLEPFLRLIPYICLLVLLLFAGYDLYSSSWKRRGEVFLSVVFSVIIANIATMALSFWFRGFAFPRSVFFLATIFQILLLGGWRLLWQGLLDRVEAAKLVVVIGGNGVEKLAGTLGSLLGRRYHLIGAFDINQELAVACEAITSAQVVCLNGSLPAGTRKTILARCLKEDKEVYLVPDLSDILVHQALLSRVDDLPLFQIQSLTLSQGQKLAKRCFDLAFAITGIVILSPLLLAIALVVRLTSPGPVFYTQERIGYNGERFLLIKFRTMVEQAERLSGPVFAGERDPRVTGVGRWLRSTRLDELPQLFNILKGEMSLVGPRPERPYFVEQYLQELPEYRFRFKVKPGLTGLAQVEGKYDTAMEGKLRYDLYYICSYSLLLDLRIILQTLRVVLLPETARGVKSSR